MSAPLSCSKKDPRTLVYFRFDRSSLGRNLVSTEDLANYWTFDADTRTHPGGPSEVSFADQVGSLPLENTVGGAWGVGNALDEDDPGKFEEGVYVDGGSGLFAASTGTAFTFPGDFTIALWWRSKDAGTQPRHPALLSKAYYDSFFGPSGNCGWTIVCLPVSRDLRFYCNVVTLDAPGALVHDGDYHHIVVRRVGNEWSLWVDGVQVDSATAAGAISFADAPAGTSTLFFVADHNTGSTHGRWPGHYDSLGIWDGRGLEDEEIAAAYNLGAGRELSFEGGPEELFLVAGTDDYTDGDGQLWTRVPTLEVKLPPYSGLLGTKAAAVKLPSSIDLALLLSNGEPFPPTLCVIYEDIRQFDADPDAESPAQTTRLTLFRGRVGKGFRNAEGRKGRVLLEVLAAKAQLNVPLGVPSTPTCAWTFMDRRCSVDPEAVDLPGVGVTNLLQRAEVTSINGTTLEVDNVTSHGDSSHGEIYTFGFLRRGDLRIGIRRWQRGTFVFELDERPPSWWLGEDVEVYPGCDKAKATCDARFDNLARFGGLGIAIPNSHPVFEVADE